MKSYRVWAMLSSDLNVWQAWRECERRKRRRADVAEFARDADRHVLRIAERLRAGTWRHGPYRLIRVIDPKRRLVAAASVADRVAHHAVHRVLAPRYNRRFIEHSYACQPGRGTHRALLAWIGRAQRWPWVLHLDMARYFYEIEHVRLRELMARAFPEPRVGALLDEIVSSGRGLYQHPDVVRWLGWPGPQPVGRGLPIGNLTSQWWGNVYLDGLDHFAQRTLRVPGYQRYMDDVSLFGQSRAQLLDYRHVVTDWLRQERGLRLKDPEAQPTSTHAPRTILGYRVSREGLAIGDKTRTRFRQRMLAGRVDDAGMQSTIAAWMFGS